MILPRLCIHSLISGPDGGNTGRQSAIAAALPPRRQSLELLACDSPNVAPGEDDGEGSRDVREDRESSSSTDREACVCSQSDEATQQSSPAEQGVSQQTDLWMRFRPLRW